MRVQLLGRRQILLIALGMAVTTGCMSARQAMLTTLPPGHSATLYSSRTPEPVALVVTPPGMTFAVKMDPGIQSRSLTSTEFAALIGTLVPAKDSRLLPTDVHVFVAVRHINATSIECPPSGVRAVVTDPTEAGGSGGGSGGSGGGGGSGGKGSGAS